MQTVKHGGLSGKARRAHVRNRVARLHARQIVNEYFEPDTEDLYPERYIPIRGRREFLPSILQADDESMAARGSGTAWEQLEFLHSAHDGRETPGPARGERRGRATENGTNDHDAVIRFPQTQRTSAPAPGFQSNKSREELTLRGFLLGCTMGGAAAAVVLLVLRTAMG